MQEAIVCLCSPGSKRSIPGVLPPQLCIWDPSGTRYHYRPSLQRHLLVLNEGRGELSEGLHPGPPEIGTELIKPLMKRQQFFSTSVPATRLHVQKSAVKRPTLESCWQCQPHQPGRAGPRTQRSLWQGSGRPYLQLCAFSRAVQSHGHAGGAVGAGLEQGEWEEEWDAGCGEHPCLPRGGRALQPQGVFLPTHWRRAETGPWRRTLPKNMPGTRVDLDGPAGESRGAGLGGKWGRASVKSKGWG